MIPCIWGRQSNTGRWIAARYEQDTVSMNVVKIFFWWFIMGATMTLAVIMLQGGIREVMQAQGSLWEIKIAELLTLILGGGLLGGCIALLLDRIRKP